MPSTPASPAPLVVPVVKVPGLDEAAMAEARERQTRLTKPLGALGRLEEISIRLAGMQGVCPPRPFGRIRSIVVAGDHGIAADGVSAYPPEVTAQMVANFAAGGAAVNVLAGLVGGTVRVIDIAVDADLADGLADTRHKVRRGSGRIDREDALTEDELTRAFAAGVAIADEEVDAGADLLIPGDMGIGNTTASAAVVGTLLDLEPTAVVGRGTGIDDARWMVKTAAVRDALRRGRPHAGDARAVLRTVGGADLAALAGLLAQAAVRRTPVILDGVVVTAAALAAARIAPGAERWWFAGHRSPEPAQQQALTALALEPLVDLGLRLGEGTGALVAAPLVVAAGAVLAGMATFDEAGVSDKTT